MKVFISWSGDSSKKLAYELSIWFPKVIQSLKLFYSPEDIGKGNKWFSEIESYLNQSELGILCLTVDNANSPWIMFEAGALSKNVGQARVIPLLFGINHMDISGPLSQFQATKFDKEDFVRLIRNINEMMNENSFSNSLLSEIIEKWWPELEQKVETILNKKFLSKEIKKRTSTEVMDEMLEGIRHLEYTMQTRKLTIHPNATRELVGYYIDVCNSFPEMISNNYADEKFRIFIYGSIARISFIESPILNLLNNTDLPNDELSSLKNEFEEAKVKNREVFNELKIKLQP